ncbi:MAG TPA: hypothetical protein VFD49_21410 [Candidatus Dormibacteraeota bacterium]|nr:hypothetical protein [Candidatus Dormibacteraeota bacterium]
MSDQQGQALVAVLVVMTLVFLLAGAVAFGASALLAQQRQGAGDPVQADFIVDSAVAAAVAQVEADPGRCPGAPRRPAPAGAPSPVASSPSPGEREIGEGRSSPPTPRPSPSTPWPRLQEPTARPPGPGPSRSERQHPRAPGSPATTTSPATPATTSPATPAPTLPIILPGGVRSGASCLRLDGVLQGPGRAPLDRQPNSTCATAVLPALRGRAWVFFAARWQSPGAAWIDARPAPACVPPPNGDCEQRLPAGSPALVQVALDCDLSGLEPPVLHLTGASTRSALFAGEGGAGTSLYLLAVGTGSAGEEVVLTGGDGGLVLRDEEPVP